MPKQGEIVLIPIPFTDLSSQKQRPVIIISNESYHSQTTDMVVVAMTSNLVSTPYGFTVTSKELQQGALKRPSMVRADKIYTLSQTLIRRTFGVVSPQVLKNIQSIIIRMTTASPPKPSK